MKEPQLSIGKKIYIQSSDENNAVDEFEYVSQISDAIDENTLIISTPIYKGMILSFYVGQNIKILFTHENGIYIYNGEIIEHVLENNLLLYKICIKDEGNRVQRREYFRIPINTAIVYSYIHENKEYYNQGITKDLSAGGLRFVCGTKLQAGTKINIYIKVTEEQELNADAEVIRCKSTESKSYEISIKFINFDFKKRESLISNIFKIQREKLRKMNKS